MPTYPTPLTPNAVQTIFQSITLAALGLSPTAFDQVRVSWQVQGQPTWKVADDVVILRTVEDDDAYNRVRDQQLLPNDDVSQLQLTTYTRVWRVFWTLYGPSSFDRARIIKSSLFTQAQHDVLALANLYAVTDFVAPQRMPENFEGQWWERTDFTCQFNEAVFETLVIPTVASVDVNIVTVDLSVQ